MKKNELKKYFNLEKQKIIDNYNDLLEKFKNPEFPEFRTKPADKLESVWAIGFDLGIQYSNDYKNRENQYQMLKENSNEWRLDFFNIQDFQRTILPFANLGIPKNQIFYKKGNVLDFEKTLKNAVNKGYIVILHNPIEYKKSKTNAKKTKAATKKDVEIITNSKK